MKNNKKADLCTIGMKKHDYFTDNQEVFFSSDCTSDFESVQQIIQRIAAFDPICQTETEAGENNRRFARRDLGVKR